MNDRELLEAAARAAGNGPLDFDYAEREGHGFYLGPRLPMTKGVLMAAMWTNWNPLEDDGDALRLAVMLNLRIRPNFNGSHAYCFGDDQNIFTQYIEGDPFAATRRAIVRAAAAIGSKP